MLSVYQNWVLFNLQYPLTGLISEFDLSEVDWYQWMEQVKPVILECICQSMGISANEIGVFFNLQSLLPSLILA